MVNENEPVKCPDCSTWWRGLEHKCKPRANKPIRPQSKLDYDFHKENKGCPLCGAKGVHYCQGKRMDYSYTCGWCGKSVDYRYSHYCKDRGKD